MIPCGVTPAAGAAFACRREELRGERKISVKSAELRIDLPSDGCGFYDAGCSKGVRPVVDSMHDRSVAGSLRRPRLMHGACSLMALVAIGLAVAPSAWAQPGLNSPFGADEDREELRARREAHAPRIENALRQAQAVREANPELAIDIIQSIFDAPEDSYFVTPAGISLKDAAESLLLENRDQLLVPYERRFEPAAAGLSKRPENREPWKDFAMWRAATR